MRPNQMPKSFKAAFRFAIGIGYTMLLAGSASAAPAEARLAPCETTLNLCIVTDSGATNDPDKALGRRRAGRASRILSFVRKSIRFGFSELRAGSSTLALGTFSLPALPVQAQAVQSVSTQTIIIAQLHPK